MTLAHWTLLLLVGSTIPTGFGIWWTGQAVLRETKVEGIMEGQTAKNAWEAWRGVVALGLGLLLNTAASLLSIIPAL